MNQRSQEMRRLFRYQAWAHEHMQAALELSELPQAALASWSHLLVVNRLWLQRVRLESEECRVAASCFTLHDTARLLAILADGWSQVLTDITDSELTRIVTYHSTHGHAQADSLADVLQHVLLHSAYHRGQVATLAQITLGMTPNVEFISFAREESAPPKDSRRVPLSDPAHRRAATMPHQR